MDVRSVGSDETKAGNVDGQKEEVNDTDQKTNGLAEQHLPKSSTSNPELKGDRVSHESRWSLVKKYIGWCLFGFENEEYVRYLLDKGDFSKAFEISENAFWVSEGVNDDERQAGLLEMIVDAYLKEEDLSEVLSGVLEAVKAVHDDERQAGIARSVVEYALERRKVREARLIVQEVRDDERREELAEIIKTAFEQKEVNKASHTVEEVRDDEGFSLGRQEGCYDGSAVAGGSGG